MEFRPNHPLSEVTTFRIGGPASFFVEVQTEAELRQALDFAKSKNLQILVIGGGSNLLVADKGFDGLVIQVAIKGIQPNENQDSTLLTVGSGENWDDVVEYAVKQGLWGIENLSSIPGRTGAIPVQNVGAYGQEARNVVEEVEVLDLQTLEKKIIKNSECGFGYRKSNFNTIWKNHYAILSVIFKLSKTPNPFLEYTDVKKYFDGKPQPTQKEIREAIIEIRKNKFPDIRVSGNAGSCFKNLILDESQFNILQENIRKNFNQETLDKLLELKTRLNGKVPAAFLIDICGLKGKTVGGARLWEKQPLVIANSGKATASDVLQLMNEVKNTVATKTGMALSIEPEFIGF